MDIKLKISKQNIVDVLKKRWWVMLIEFLLVGIILVLDLVSKEYVCKYLFTMPNQEADFMKGFIDFYYIENTGAGFGVLSGNTLALSIITIIVVAGIMVFLMLAQNQNEWLRISLIFVSAGGIGNVVDRLGLGYVRDFLKFTFWPQFAVFNVADAFVTVGAFMLIVVLIIMLFQEGQKSRKEFEEKKANGEIPEEVPVDPFEEPVNDFLPNENGVATAPEDSDEKELEEYEELDDLEESDENK